MPKRYGPLAPFRKEDLWKPSTERVPVTKGCGLQLEATRMSFGRHAERNLRSMAHGLLENTPGRITCQVCPWLISTSSGRYICKERRTILCMSQRVTRVKTRFGELRDIYNWRETFLSSSLVQFHSLQVFVFSGMGSLRRNSSTQMNVGPWLWTSYLNCLRLFSHL